MPKSPRSQGPLKALGPLRWFTVPVRGPEVTVYFSTEKLTPSMKGCRGCTIRTPGKFIEIFINALFPEVYEEIAFHELLGHAVLWDAELPLKTEERFVTAQAPGAAALLKVMGFRWPDKPRGLEQLEEEARKS